MKLGIVVLTNGLNLFLPSAIAYRILDEILGRPLEPAQSSFWASWQQMAPAAAAAKFTAPSNSKPLDELQLARAPGAYESGLYGSARVRAEGGHLILEVLGREVRLHPIRPGRFAPDWGDDPYMNAVAPTLIFAQGTDRAGDRLILDGVAFSRTR